MEIECVQKVSKGSRMNKLKKFKAIHCRSLETDNALTSRECTAWASETQNIAKCDGPASKSSRSEFSPNSIKDQRLKAGNSHKLLQRSISAAADHDHDHHHAVFDHFDKSSSLSPNSGIGGGAGVHDKDNDKKNCSFQDILSAMRGPPYDVEAFTSDDTSPLIQSDAEPFRGARNSFDNLEITESMSLLTEGHLTSTVSTNDNAIIENNCPQPTSRRKPELKILTPGLEGNISCGLKKMSAIDERQMNEAIELANSFSRLSTGSGPHTPGSLSDGCRSPGGHFFGLRKGRSGKEEKRTFAEELSLLSTETDRMVSPSALEAYEVLVKRTLPGKTDTQCAFGGNFLTDRDSGELATSSKGNQEPLSSLLALDRKCAGAPIASESRASGSTKNSEEFPSQTFPSAHRSRETFALSRSLSLGNPERSSKENEEDAEVVDSILSSLMHFQEKFSEFDDLSPPAYPAPMPPSKLKTARPEPLRRRSESGEAFVDTIRHSPLPLPEKKSRRVGVVLPIEISLPQHQAPMPPPPAVPPPVLPPRVPLRRSTVNSRPYERRFPLTSEFPSRLSQSEEAIRLDVVGHRNLPQKLPREAGTAATHGARPCIKEARSKGLCASLESQVSCESDAGDATRGSEDGDFGGDSVLPGLSPKPRTADSSALLAGDSGRPIELNIRKVKLNAAELGLYDKADLFWDKSVSFSLPEKSQCEGDLLQDVSVPIPGRYETSDSVSYEDLMEFALDRPVKTSSLHELMCDEVCVLMKMFPNALTVEDCMDALIETFWDVHSAVKLIKLKQVMSTGVADKQQCKQALLFCQWNVNDAAHYLQTPPQQRVTPDLVDV